MIYRQASIREMTKLCYVTAFLDINRGEWTNFTRSFDDYLSAFLPYVDLFKNDMDKDCEMVVYIDDRHYERVREAIAEDLPIKVIKINEGWLHENFVMWKRLEREQEILDSEQFKLMVGQRIKFPECQFGKYNLINHSKIEFVAHALENHTDAEYLLWSDFGYFMIKDRIPPKLVDVDKLVSDRINFTMINPLDDSDNDMYQTLRNGYEKFGGFFFAGRRDKLVEYNQLYQDVHAWAHDHGICDDDQGLLTQIYSRKPDLFALHLLGVWHAAFLWFTKN